MHHSNLDTNVTGCNYHESNHIICCRYRDNHFREITQIDVIGIKKLTIDESQRTLPL